MSNNLKAIRRLILKCEDAKIDLSNMLVSNIELDCLSEGEDFIILLLKKILNINVNIYFKDLERK